MAINTNQTAPTGKRSLAARTEKPSGALDSKLSPDQGPAIEQQMAAIDSVGLRNKMRARDAAQATEPKSVGDTLLGTESLIKLGLAAAAAGFGGEAGQGIGMALAGGTLRGATQHTNQFNQDRQKEIDDLSGMVDKQQQRLVTLLQSQPGMFLDDEGQNLVKPGEWAELLELGVPINVHGLVTAATTSRGQKERGALAWKMINDGRSNNNIVVTRQGVALLNEAYGLNMSPELQNEFSQMNDGSMFETLTKIFTIDSVAGVMKDYKVGGLDPYSPEQYAKLVKKLPDGPMGTPAGAKFQKGVAAQMKLQKYIEDGHQSDWQNDAFGTMKDAFLNDATGYADLLDSASYYNIGEERTTIRVREGHRAFADSMDVAITMAGIEGDDEAILTLIEKRAWQARQQEDMATGVYRNATSTESVTYLGTAFVTRYKDIPKAFAGEAGINISVRQAEFARSQGTEWGLLSQVQKDKVTNWAMSEEALKFYGDNPEIIKSNEDKRAAAAAALLESSKTDASVAKAAPKDVVVESEATSIAQATEMSTDDKSLNALSRQAKNPKSNIAVSAAQKADIAVFDEWAARPSDERAALVTKTEIAQAIGTVVALSGVSMSPAVVAETVRTEKANLDLLETLRAEKDPVERDLLARGATKYMKALEWEANYLLIPADVLSEERTRQESIERGKSSLKYRRR